MALNTYRMLAIIIAMNLLISVAIGIYQAPTTFDSSVADNSIDIGIQNNLDIRNEESTIQPTNYQQEGSYGNSIRMGLKVVGLLARGLSPFPFGVSTYCGSVTALLALGLLILRGFMGLMIGILIYDKIKNRGQG